MKSITPAPTRILSLIRIQKSYFRFFLFLRSSHNTLNYWWLFMVSTYVLVLTSLLSGSFAEAAAKSSGKKFSEACEGMLALIEGPFGAMICAGAGIAAVCAAAFGSFKMAWSLLIIGVGAFILRGYLSIFFNGCEVAAG